MNKKLRASSDLIVSSSSLNGILNIEALTIDGHKVSEHCFDVLSGEVTSNDHNAADPTLQSLVNMLAKHV